MGKLLLLLCIMVCGTPVFMQAMDQKNDGFLLTVRGGEMPLPISADSSLMCLEMQIDITRPDGMSDEHWFWLWWGQSISNVPLIRQARIRVVLSLKERKTERMLIWDVLSDRLKCRYAPRATGLKQLDAILKLMGGNECVFEFIAGEDEEAYRAANAVYCLMVSNSYTA